MADQIRILILEDVAEDVICINHRLRKAGMNCRITPVTTRKDFLFELEQHRPDVILSDHGLPSFDGFSALELARQRQPDVPFIFVTNSLGEQTTIAAFESGATDYVLKSQLGNLAPAIKRALRNAKEENDHRRAETALHEIEESFRLVMEGIEDYAIFMMDPEGHVTFWNAGTQKLFDWQAEEVRGRNFSMLYTAEDLANRKPQLALKSAAKMRLTEEGWRVGKNGKKFMASITLTPVRDAQGKLRGFTQVTRDITAHRRAQEQLFQSEERYRTLVENVTDYAIYLLDAEGRVATWNTGAERLMGYTAKEILGKSYAVFFTREEADTGLPLQLLKKAERDGRAFYEGPRVRKDGSRYWVQGAINALRDDFGKLRGFSKVARDVTRQREDAEKINQLNNELEQRVVHRTAQLEAANKELEAFNYSISHDLRAPLLRISGFADILQHEAAGKLDQQNLKHLQSIVDGALQMTNLIDALLEFSRMGRTELRQRNVDMNRLVKEATSELCHEFEGRDVEWQIADLPDARGDPIMLRQVMINLLSNALKYTRPRRPAKIEIGARTEPDEIVYFVRDNGVGFDMNYAGKLFQVFRRLHSARDFEGVGIGLANVQRIVGRHGGRAWGEGAVDQGAVFYFSLHPSTKEKPIEKT